MQIYAINDSSMCIRKNNQIIIWGSNENGIMGNEKSNVEGKKKNNNYGFIAVNDFTEIIKTSMIKDNDDYSEAFISSRKLFNTKYNQIKRDNLIKKTKINELEEKKKGCIEYAQRSNAKNVNFKFNIIRMTIMQNFKLIMTQILDY